MIAKDEQVGRAGGVVGNELKDAASPYLIQHKDNPVHWRMWGLAALDEAKRLDRPILPRAAFKLANRSRLAGHQCAIAIAHSRLMLQ